MSVEPPIVDQQSEQYRRGQVLGFTMAEIMLVLLFLLLILLGDEITDLTRDLEVYISPQSAQGESAILISQTLQTLKSQGQISESETELSLTEKLVLRAADTVNEVGVDEETEETIARLTRERDQLRSINEVLERENESLSRELDKDPQELERQRMAEDLLNSADRNRVSFEKAMMCMDDCGGGDGKEACWGDSISNPDYIYTVALYDDYIWVKPDESSIDKHKQDWDAMPDAARVESATYLSNAEYQRRFSALRRYADAKNKGPQGCVFSVRLFDLGTTTKETYKKQESMVQLYTFRTPLSNQRWVGEQPPLPPAKLPSMTEGGSDDSDAGLAVDTDALIEQRQVPAEGIASPTVTPPEVLKRASPAYPRRAQSRGIEGSCIVAFDVNAQGKVVNVAAIPDQCNPRGVFNTASEEAMSKFVYRPRYVDGKPVDTNGLRQTFSFRLD